ncbi:hypothetical protein [Gluconacetobacter diazotrophicus]|uniref:hypothetical protein n=1 Tax=Gluconacetobacter diazotrophicus TaxID=33996 RepID=UPI00119DC3F3|nr:hypothetical protein [Gluconacetobacter diazotrophicus]
MALLDEAPVAIVCTMAVRMVGSVNHQRQSTSALSVRVEWVGRAVRTAKNDGSSSGDRRGEARRDAALNKKAGRNVPAFLLFRRLSSSWGEDYSCVVLAFILPLSGRPVQWKPAVLRKISRICAGFGREIQMQPVRWDVRPFPAF